MTPAQAENLAVRLSQRWKSLGQVDELADDLIDLDEGAANTAYVQLRRTSERPPTLADFRRATLALDTHDPLTERPACEWCDGSGWVRASDHHVHDQAGDTRTYTQVEPCHCHEGRQRSASRTWTGRTR